ncbi:MAG: D-hexose-6-phosphate mutarotase [Mariprofundales bacterium]|nr:D-hexose-6-phosphate mutarotase [Mariprofundales bacterium]
MRSQIEQLNEQFAITNHLQFQRGREGIVTAHIDNALGRAAIALQGAQLISYQATDGKPLIWISSDARYAPGNPLRGGIPICWPWFGPHELDSSLPNHGTARTATWLPTATAALDDGATLITFTMEQHATTRKIYGDTLQVAIHFTIGSRLTITLESSNLGTTPVTISEALHSYFMVGDIRQATIAGLDGCSYLDKVDGMVCKQQQGDVVITAETDRIYLDTKGEISITDPVMQRKVVITATGSASTVIWNPWRARAEEMGDMGSDGYLNMLCVESANAASNRITIAAGGTHRLTTTYTTKPL